MSDSPFDPFRSPTPPQGQTPPESPATPQEPLTAEAPAPPPNPFWTPEPIQAPPPITPQPPANPQPLMSPQPMPPPPIPQQPPTFGLPNPAQGPYAPLGGFQPPPQNAPQSPFPPQGGMGAQPQYGQPGPPSRPAGGGSNTLAWVLGLGCLGALILGIVAVVILYYIGKAHPSGSLDNTTTTTSSTITTPSSTTSSDSSGTTSGASSSSTTPGGSSSSASAPAIAGWKSYTSDAGKYATSFPSTPKETTSKTTGGRELKSAIAETEAGAYMVMYMNLGTTPDEATTNRSLDGAAKSVAGQGTLISSTTTTYVGQPAREVVVEKDVSGKPAVITDMIFIAKDRLIQVMTVISKGSDETANTKKFQDVFKLTD